MPSFDVTSQVDMQEIVNAVDQANREVNTRFDFKGTGAKFELAEKNVINLRAQNTFQLQQMMNVLEIKMAKRKIDIRFLEVNKPQESLHEAKQSINIKQGINQEAAKNIIKIIKDSKLKVQASIQGEQVRVTGKKRDDLQEAIALLRGKELNIPLQYGNFRD